MAAHHALLSLGFSRQEHWSGLPLPSPMHESEKWKWSRSVVPNSSRPHGLQPTRLLRPWDFPGKSTGAGCHCLLRIYFLLEHNKLHHHPKTWADLVFKKKKWTKTYRVFTTSESTSCASYTKNCPFILRKIKVETMTRNMLCFLPSI